MDAVQDKTGRDEIDALAATIAELKVAKGPQHEDTKAAVAKMAELRSRLGADKPKAGGGGGAAAGAKGTNGAASAPAADGATEYFNSRVAAVKEVGQYTGAFPHKFNRQLTFPDFISKFKPTLSTNGQRLENQQVTVAGRIIKKRSAGANLHFLQLQGDGTCLQVISMRDNYSTGKDSKLFVEGSDGQPQDFAGIHSLIKRGDIVGVAGVPGLSNNGELSIFAYRITLLSACFHMLPDTYFGLSNIEQRFRERHLDLIVAPVRAETFKTRSKIINHVRSFFDSRDFVEVETPVLGMLAGGAAARPFETHHNELNQKMFLRIAPELYLKQLVVGGMDRVYELGKQFRNEGIDLTHNPEFTSVEAYWAYTDYNDIMRMTEEMLSTLAMKIHGSFEVPFNPMNMQTGEPLPDLARVFNFKPPYQRLYILPELESRLKVKFPEDFETDESNQWLQDLCKKNKIECLPPLTTSRLLDALISEILEPLCTQPTFICDHPRVMSPLAKWHRDDPRLTERFEMFVNKKELCNAYTELNNPLVQREEFVKQLKNKAKGDDESMPVDEGFLKALELGLPPTGGWGMGIDRLVMFMTSNISIKEVLLFPAMRPEQAAAAAPPTAAAAAPPAAAV